MTRLTGRNRRLHAITATADGRTGIEHSFQREHLLAASYFVALARRLETRGAAVVGPEGMTRHRACVTGAIVSSVAFLESSINELYLEFQSAGDPGSSLPRRAQTQLEHLWPSVDGARAHRSDRRNNLERHKSVAPAARRTVLKTTP